MSSIINSIASAISSSSGSATGSSSRQWKSAAQLALHLLKKNGPTTTQALYKACSATEAPSEKEYRAPGHRDYRIIDGVVRNGTVRPPQPNHLVRSVRFLKLTLQELESAGQIGHAPTAKLIALSEDKLASEATIPQEQRTALSEALAEIKQVHERNLAAKESPFVWIDGERWKTLAAAGAGIKRSPKPSKAKRTSRSPRVALGERDREGRSGVYGRRQEASY